MAEKFVVDMTQLPQTSIEALAILDFVMGDEWAGISAEYANLNVDTAIQLLEQEGLVGSLPERYREWIHRYLWED